MIMIYQLTSLHCKKPVDFTVKYLASGCQFFYRYFYGRLPVEHFYKSRYSRVMLTDSTRKYLRRIIGLYDKKEKKKKKKMAFATALCPDS